MKKLNIITALTVVLILIVVACNKDLKVISKFGYSAWSSCLNNFQTREYTRVFTANNSDRPPADSLKRSCVSPCTSFIYSDWTACSNNVQTRTYRSPVGCSGDSLPGPPADSIQRPCVILSSVQIGNQTWTLENLDIATYRNGDIIPQVQDPTNWANLSTGAWCYYNNDPNLGSRYGKLYNWYAVNDPRGLAPNGYHIPTDAEWTTLTTHLGGESVAGGKMKEAGTSSWLSPNTNATNSSGFSGLPGGYRGYDGNFGSVGAYGNWWSSSEGNTVNAWFRNLYNNYGSVGRGLNSRRNGFSVRCLRD